MENVELNKADTTQIRYLDDIFTSFDKEVVEYKPDYKLIIYQPSNDTETKRPYIIVLHAGGGKVEDVEGWCLDWCRKGYVALTAEYKLDVGEFNAEKQKEAVVNMFDLLYYLRSNATKYKLKKKKVFAMGVSAGALTALQTGIGLNDRFGPYFQNSVIPDNNKLNMLATATLSGAANPEFMNLIDSEDCPNYFYHGELDKTIPYSAALATYNLQKSYGINSTMMSFPDKGHKLESHDIILKDLTAKFYSKLNV